MRFKRPHTSSDGTEYPNAVWEVTSIQLHPKQKIGRIVFTGYKNAKAAQDDMPIDGAVKTYLVNTPGLYDEYFGYAEQPRKQKSLVERMHDLALNIKDTGEGEAAVSFFEGSVNE